MDELREDDVLIHCALRFDGYKYAEATRFDPNPSLVRFWATGQWTLSPEEQLCAFFMLQRGLYKWSLEREPRHGKYWRAFRSLFLEVYAYEVAEGYRMRGWYDEWEEKYRPRLDECVALVQGIHEATPYDDEAGPVI